MIFDVYYGMYIYVKFFGKFIMYLVMEICDIIMLIIIEIVK